MEHPPKQGLKHGIDNHLPWIHICFNGTSTKTRIETGGCNCNRLFHNMVLMEHPPKQGLKRYMIDTE